MEDFETNRAFAWSYMPVPPIRVISVDMIDKDDEEREDVIIMLSNGDKLEFDLYWPIGPEQYIKKERHASLAINGTYHDVLSEYDEMLEQYGSVTLTILKIYERIIENKAIELLTKKL